MSEATPLVGVVADGESGAGVADAVADAGGRSTSGTAADVIAAEPAAVVAIGEAAFARVATRAPPVPVLPVGVGRGVRSVPESTAEAALEGLVAGEYGTERHPLLAVAVDGEPRGVAAFDVTVITAEAAHISEYRVSAGDATLASVRADGVVVATPAGSAGYARRIGAPVVAPETGVVVAPIAPFATDPDHWVVEPEEVAVDQVRAEAGVELVVDATDAGALDPAETVRCRVDGHVSTILLPESRPRYG